MKKTWILILTGILLIGGAPSDKTRKPIDQVGFATQPWQMDSVMDRIFSSQGKKILDSWDFNGITKSTSWKVALCPHDDYTYAGWLYPAVLRNIKASTVILIGVAHKAKKFGIEDKIVFDNYDYWQEPYGPTPISGLREKIMNKLPASTFIVSDSLHQAEHSLEALAPVLQYYNRQVRIIPVLIPTMSFTTMDGLAGSFARSITSVMQDLSLEWDRDIALVISNDAVHYGDEDWGGQNYAPYGVDSAGYLQALTHEYEIINNCLTGELTKNKIRRFTDYTVSDTNYRCYKWTWCGRYSVPFGLLTALYMEQSLRSNPVKGVLLGYGNSIMQNAIPVEDLKMGKTAGASLRHWVGYAAIGYR
ncbi:MAG: AmmeMemoRadiSam system protein B [Bacteroidales bacterium]|nr:AmmeMemoRadiSam system protein B [Bacteroidales bacterium]